MPGSAFKKFDEGQCSLPETSNRERYKSKSYPAIRRIAHAVALDEKRSGAEIRQPWAWICRILQRPVRTWFLLNRAASMNGEIYSDTPELANAAAPGAALVGSVLINV